MKVALKICQEVSTAEQAARTIDVILFEVGAPTIVVNNAGVMNGKLILDLEEKDVMR